MFDSPVYVTLYLLKVLHLCLISHSIDGTEFKNVHDALRSLPSKQIHRGSMLEVLMWQFWTAASLGQVFWIASQCEKFLLILRIHRNELMDLWISKTYEHSTKMSEQIGLLWWLRHCQSAGKCTQVIMYAPQHHYMPLRRRNYDMPRAVAPTIRYMPMLVTGSIAKLVV